MGKNLTNSSGTLESVEYSLFAMTPMSTFTGVLATVHLQKTFVTSKANIDSKE